MHFTVISARDELARRGDCHSDAVSDARIGLGFLEADVVRGGQSYEDIILEHYWGEYFTTVSVPLTSCKLLEDIDIQRWEANQSLPLATRSSQSAETVDRASPK